MDDESANADNGTAQLERLKAAIASRNYSPEELESIRADLYKGAESYAGHPGSPSARTLLQALPRKEATGGLFGRPSERTPEVKQLGLENHADETGNLLPKAREPNAVSRIGAGMLEIAGAGPDALLGPVLNPIKARLSKTRFAKEVHTNDAHPERDPFQSDPLAVMIATGLETGPAFPVARAAGRLVPGGEALATGSRLQRTAFGAGTGAVAGDVVARATDADPRMGRALGALGGALGEQSGAIRDPRSETGQIIEDLRRVGARPGAALFERPAVGGAMDEPAYRNLPHGEAGDLELAMRGARAIEEDVGARHATAKADLGAAERRAIVRFGDVDQDTSHPLATLEDVLRRNVGNDEPISGPLHTEAHHYQRLLTRREDFPEIPPGETYEGFPTPGEPAVTRETPAITFRELVNVKKGLREATEPGQPGTLQNAAPRRLMGELKGLATGVDPRYDAATGRYGREMGRLERVNDVLVGKDAADYADSAARERAMVRNLKTAGRNRSDERLPQLRDIANNEGDPYDSYINTLIARNAMKVGKLQPTLMPGLSPFWTILRTAREAGHALDLRILDPLSRGQRLAEPFAGIPLEAIHQADAPDKDKEESKRKTKHLLERP